MDQTSGSSGGGSLIVLIFNVVVFSGFMIFFLYYFRLKNSRVYFPKKKFDSIYRTPINWILPLLRTSDAQVRETAGILAALLLRWEIYCAILCFIFSIFTITMILPINLYWGIVSNLYSFNIVITTGTTIPASSASLWIHFFVFIIMLFFAYFMLFLYHKQFIHIFKTQKQVANINFHTVKFRGIPNNIINRQLSRYSHTDDDDDDDDNYNIKVDIIDEGNMKRNSNLKLSSSSSSSLSSSSSSSLSKEDEENIKKRYSTSSIEEYEEYKFSFGLKQNNFQNNSEMKEFFENLFPQFASDILSVHIAYDLNEILDLKQKKLEYLKELDRAEFEYQQSSKRPTHFLYKHSIFQLFNKCLKGKGGKEVDSIDYYSKKIVKLSKKIKEQQNQTHQSKIGIAFITFKSIYSAQQFIRIIEKYTSHLNIKQNFFSRILHSIQHLLLSKKNSSSLSSSSSSNDSVLSDSTMQNPLIDLMDDQQLQLTQFINSQNIVKAKAASLPEDIIWQNLEVGKVSHTIRRSILSISVLIVAFTWAIPVALLAAVATLATIPSGPGPLLNTILTFFGTIMNTLVDSFLPVLSFMIINSVIHIVLYFVTRFERVHSISTWDMSVMRNYYIFALFNNLIFPAIIMGGLSALAIKLAENNNNNNGPILGLQNIDYAVSTTFFVNYIIFQTFLARIFMILQVPDYLSRFIKRKFAKTQREFEEANIFGLFPIWLAFDQTAIILGMVMSFAVIAPLITIVGIGYFLVRFCADKTQLVAVKPKNTNTDCRIVPVLYLHFNIAVIWSEINILIFFIIKQAFKQAILMIIIIPTTLFFISVILNFFKKSKKNAARERDRLLESNFTEKELINAYLHPALYPEPPNPLDPKIRFEDSRMFLNPSYSLLNRSNIEHSPEPLYDFVVEEDRNESDN